MSETAIPTPENEGSEFSSATSTNGDTTVETAVVAPVPAASRGFLPAGVWPRLVGGAMMWLIGSSILIARGAAYLQGRKWHAWALAIALMLGVAKAHYILNRVATKSVARIRERDRAPFFSFFSARSWMLVAVMMGAGMILRRLVVHPEQIGAGILGALYLGVGTALFIADRIFWKAVAEEYVVYEEAKAAALQAAAEAEEADRAGAEAVGVAGAGRVDGVDAKAALSGLTGPEESS